MSKNEAYDYIWRDRKRTFLGLPWSFTVYHLTESKFITRTGFFNLSEDELDLYKVTDKKLELPFFQRLVGCGTIVLYVRDTDTPEKRLIVKHPRDVLAKIDKQIEQQRDRYNTRGRDLYAAQMGGHGHDSLHGAPHDPDECDCECHDHHDDQ
ncbi:MAG TPA: hypothetical protein DDX71_05135 [Ruminococcus sp.]|nr:hypothetical protein [Ruminococcus sp.]